MARYRTSFQRINYGFDPPLRQTADVVFDCDIPDDDENIEAFEQIAWDVMFEQNPHWKDSEGPIPGLPGWSSVLGDNMYVKIS